MRTVKAAVLAAVPESRQLATTLLSACGCCLLDDCVSCRQFTPELFEADVVAIECSCAADDPGVQLARRIRRCNADIRIIILAIESSESLAIEALRLGAHEYLRPPYDLRRLADAVTFSAPDKADGEQEAKPAIVGETAGMRLVKSSIRIVAPTDSSVLITGETGTGKEMVAEQLHRQSPRRDKPFVCINCAAIPDTLLESELFGYAKGAFTGAVTARSGKLAQANGGTVFFDEIGDMSLFAQAKILRAIEAKESYPLGTDRKTQLDIRIVAATNRDLEGMMKEQRFRPDLYFRLNVARITLPPLRERRSDIPLLIDHLLPQFNRTFGLHVERFEADALHEMMNYSWPGNIRELKNVLEIIFLNLPVRTISVEHLPEQVRCMSQSGGRVPAEERERLMSALLATHWNVSEAARQLHWSRMTIYRKLAKYNIASERPVTRSYKSATGCDSA